MQRATKPVINASWIGSLGFALGMILSSDAFCAPLPPVYGAAANGSDAQAMPQRWRHYALSSITPQFAWVERSESSGAPQVTDPMDQQMGFSIVLSAVGGQPVSYFNLSVARTIIDHRAQPLTAPSPGTSAELPRIGLQRTVIAPSYLRKWGETGTVGLTAVLAYQRFASLGMGEVSMRDGALLWPMMPSETSYGGGARLDVGNQIGNRLSWSFGYQSRLNMDAFNNYRGVYLDPGQFDVPANASVGVSYALSPSLSLDLGAQRVMYNDVTPFTSSALPRRFLALLGSGASPVFAWQDLTVYSAGWTWHSDSFGNLGLRYATRQQPHPTSALLRSALNANPADHTVSLGYARATSARSRLSVQAVYSSAPYFLGLPSYRSPEAVTGNNVEFEAMWALRF